MGDCESWVRRTKYSHSLCRTNSSREKLGGSKDQSDSDQGLESGVRSWTSDFRSMFTVSSSADISEGASASSRSGHLSLESSRRTASSTNLDDTPGSRARRLLLGQSVELDALVNSRRAKLHGAHSSRQPRINERVVSFDDLKTFRIATEGSSNRGFRSKSPTYLGILNEFGEGRYMKRYSSPQLRRLSSADLNCGDLHLPSLTNARSAITSRKGNEKVSSRKDSWTKDCDQGTAKVAPLSISKDWIIDRSKLLIGHKFASGAHSKLFYGKYDEKPVAIKFVRQPDNAENNELAAQLEKQFTREITILSHLHHRNVIKLIGAYKDPPVFCVITEYLSGGSLRMFLHKLEHKSLPIPKIISIALDIARGMDYIHSQGVIHRDLKPENIIFDEEFHAKIVDYGIACEDSNCDVLDDDEGTYRWMAPEMIRHKKYDKKVDVYSFGLLLWEMLTGTTPYEDMTPIQAAFAVVDKNLRPSIPADCPAALRSLIEHCWASQPDKRPVFCEIVKVLEQFDAVLSHDESLSSIPSILDHHDHKNWFAHLIERFKHGQSDVSLHHLPPKLL